MDRLTQWILQWFRNFGLAYKKPEHFTSPQWPRIPIWLYCAYRILVAGHFLIWIILSGVWKYPWYEGEGNRIKWFIYLTNWSYLTLTLSVLWQVVIVFKYEVFGAVRATGSDGMKWYHKVCWLLYNVSTNTSLAVSLMYWTSNEYQLENTHPVDLNTHLVNSVYVMLDFCITAIPIRCQHFYQGAVMCLVYVAFNATYILRGRTNALEKSYIYISIDWLNDPHGAWIASVEQLFVYIMVWIALSVLYQLRHALWKCLYHIQPSSQQTEDEKSPLLAASQSEV